MSSPQLLPYSLIVGQQSIKLALELAYIAPTLGGVLLSGHRGTGKSTAVRAFALMMHDDLPVTLPINATEDRVMGGWKIDELMRGEPRWEEGLLQRANKGMLYVDEVNLLDDHIVNIILDVASTGVLEVQRDGYAAKPESISFILIGTMNPEEGTLRPQLLDRFGLIVSVTTETDKSLRNDLLHTLLEYDKAILLKQQGKSAPLLDDALEKNRLIKTNLKNARQNFNEVQLSTAMKACCVDLAAAFQVEGHRGEYVMALAAQAYAALGGAPQVAPSHIEAIIPLSVQHRRPEFLQAGRAIWTEDDKDKVWKILDKYES